MKLLHWIVMWNLRRLQRELVKQRNLHNKICKNQNCVGHII
jgi:hypothetical protein